MSNIILYLVSNGFSIYVHSRFANIFFKQKIVSNIIMFISYFFYYIINSCTFLIFHNPYLNLLTTILPMFFIAFEYKSKIPIKIIFTVLVIAIVTLMDSILVTAFGNLSIIFSHNLATCLVYFFIELLIENIVIIKNNYNIKLLHLISLIVVPFGSIMILILNKNQSSIFIVIQSSILLIINFMIFMFYDFIIKAYNEKLRLQLMEQKNKEYMYQINLNNAKQEQLKMFRHDMKNHLQKIELLLFNKDYVTLNEYLDEYIKIYETTETFSHSGNIDVDSLLNYKLTEISKQVEIDINANLPKDLKISSFDLTVILGNLLDNSIEAIKYCENKYLSITLNYDKGVIFMDIKNSYCNDIINNGYSFKTTKLDDENHGIGLKSVQNALNHYNGEITFSYDNDLFQVKTILFDKEPIFN